MYNMLVNLINCIERTYMMTKAKSGLKDKIIGKAKEVEGKITDDKLRKAEGKAQQAKGKLKDKAAKVKKDIQEKD